MRAAAYRSGHVHATSATAMRGRRRVRWRGAFLFGSRKRGADGECQQRDQPKAGTCADPNIILATAGGESQYTGYRNGIHFWQTSTRRHVTSGSLSRCKQSSTQQYAATMKLLRSRQRLHRRATAGSSRRRANRLLVALRDRCKTIRPMLLDHITKHRAGETHMPMCR